MNDYQWYLYSCGQSGLKPLSAKRFKILLGAYITNFRSDMTIDMSTLSERKQRRLIRRWRLLTEVANLADAGRGVITAGTVIDRPAVKPKTTPTDHEDDIPPDAAPGVREPRRPLVPLLSGSGSRAYPPVYDESRAYAI